MMLPRLPTHPVAGFRCTERRHNPAGTGGMTMRQVAELSAFSGISFDSAAAIFRTGRNKLDTHFELFAAR
jgi:hypothetical protein